MEPIKDTINFVATVKSVEEKFWKEWKGGIGKEAEFINVSLGWFVALEGSHEALFGGMTKPNIAPGDEAYIRIHFRHAQPKQTPV